MPIEPRDMGLQKETSWRKMGDQRSTKWILCRSAVYKVEEDVHPPPHEELEVVRRCTALNQAAPAQIIERELQRVPSDMLQQEDRDITYALFCSVLCSMEQVLFDEILILHVEENPHVYDKRRASYKDEKMKENTWLSIAASLNTDLVMDDLMKMEPDSDPLAIETSDNADTEEGKLLSEEGDLLDFHFVAIKTECMDHRYEVKSEMTYEEAAVSVDFPIVKTEAERNSVLHSAVNQEWMQLLRKEFLLTSWRSKA
ncbi:hypothetical protein ANN_27510 [Periplaneta americana]|uniref:MADF domain-containing protein n=1 Tax=Periplaneta americana TaxID=6978 RepID=A0ABQ8RW55_PERAM|nr:hypothetical protein ANN_27510 [Periplaneta americana]